MCITNFRNHHHGVAGISHNVSLLSTSSLLAVTQNTALALGNLASQGVLPEASSSLSSSAVSDTAKTTSQSQQQQQRQSKADDNYKAKQRRRLDNNIVQHNYHDHASDPSPPFWKPRGGPVTTFPIKLYEMLERVERDGFEHIVRWQPHGRSFVVRRPDLFKETLLPRYFGGGLTKMASFQRQLNLWGFSRLTRGEDRGGYYHELFLRGKQFLVHDIIRVKVKGTRIRAKANPEQEPNFWQMPPVGDGEQQQQRTLPPPTSAPPKVASSSATAITKPILSAAPPPPTTSCETNFDFEPIPVSSAANSDLDAAASRAWNSLVEFLDASRATTTTNNIYPEDPLEPIPITAAAATRTQTHTHHRRADSDMEEFLHNLDVEDVIGHDDFNVNDDDAFAELLLKTVE